MNFLKEIFREKSEGHKNVVLRHAGAFGNKLVHRRNRGQALCGEGIYPRWGAQQPQKA